MAFGQPSGPPAPARQVKHLLELLQQAGHSDFRDARGPMGFNQRQAAGKFTRDEADAFVAQLERESENTANGDQKGFDTRTIRTLSNMTSDTLAAELQRRGWVVMEP